MVNKTLSVLAIVLFFPVNALAYVGFDDEGDPMYGWSDSENPSDSDSPDYDYSSISGSGTSISFWDRDTQGPFDIGFDFEYYGEFYDQVYVSGYGLIAFDSPTSTWSPTELPSVSAPNNIIAGAWCSNYAYYESNAYYDTEGSGGSRRFIVEFNLMDWDYWTYVDFQIVLEEGTNDIYVYVESSTMWSTTSIGIENEDGTRGVSSYYNTPSTTPLEDYAAFFSPALERPRVRVMNPELVVEEGGSIDLEIEVTDRQGDHLTTVWDIDGDGEYDDGEGDNVTVSAEGVDGPGVLTPAVRADDAAGNVTDRVIEIDVINMPPVFTVEPELEVLRLWEWNYDPVIADPGNDTVTVTAEERPAGMTVLGGGALRWTPNEDDIGPHTVRLVARDDDDDPDIEGDGDATLEFTLTVVDNTPPGPPLIVRPERGETVDTLRPTFLVQTPVDADGNDLTIHFDVDTADNYASPNLVYSGPIPANLGQTGWTPTVDLIDGERYNWRVYAHDGVDQGVASTGRFYVEVEGGDAGVDSGPDDEDAGPGEPTAGCGCRTMTASSAMSPTILALTIAAIFGALRRRR